jgi:AcrR family transcriptional regulator
MNPEVSAPYPTIEEVTRNKLMDAGITCIQRIGFDKTTIKDIARESGIARQTVYNYYKNKSELIADAFRREGLKLAAQSASYVSDFDTAEEMFVQGFLYIYEHFPKNSVLALLLEPGNSFLQKVGMTYYPFEFFCLTAFAPIFARYPYLKESSEDISELWIRSVLSFLTMPSASEKTDKQLEQFVRKCLVPGLGLKDE